MITELHNTPKRGYRMAKTYHFETLVDVEKFLANPKKKPFRPKTQEGYRIMLHDFDRYITGLLLPIDKVTDETVLAWLGSHRTWGDSQRYKGWAAVRSYVRWRYGAKHPILDLRIAKPAVKPQRTFDAQQIDKLLESINMDTPIGLRDCAMVMLMVDTGLRKAEVCRLELEHVNLAACELDVEIKGGEWGSGDFSPETGLALEDWITVRKEIALPGTKTLFCSVGGNQPGSSLTPDGLGCIFKYLSKKAGFTVSPHDLRRTMACLLTEAGAPTEVTRRAGRWKNLEQVKTYTQRLNQKKAIANYFPMRRIREGDI
jgi:site-specific recombinase XerD